jgi:transporter family-2 protein
MRTDLIYFLLALVTGALIPVQAATNTLFSKSVGNPIITGLMVFTVGFLAMLLFVLISKTPFPTIQHLKAAPFSGYMGGLIIATYVIMITYVAPRIGVGPAIGLIVTGQIICAVMIDHFGWFSVNVRTIDLPRLTGVMLMIAGVVLIMRK